MRTSAADTPPRRPSLGVVRGLQEAGAVLRQAWTAYERDRARYLAAAMVYYALVSLVPLVLLLLSALGLLLRFSRVAAETRDQVLLGLEANFGAPVTAPIGRLLEDLTQDSILATGVSLAGLLLAASVLFLHLRLGFRAIWHVEPPLVAGSLRLAVWQTLVERGTAFVMVLGAGALLVVGLLVIAVTQQFNRFVGSESVIGQGSGWLLTAASSFCITAMTFAALLRTLPPVRVRWRDVAIASLLCATVCVAANELLTLYSVVARESGSAYGLIGAFLAVLLWMKVVSNVLFFGGELCKVLAARRSAAESGGPGAGDHPPSAGPSPTPGGA